MANNGANTMAKDVKPWQEVEQTDEWQATCPWCGYAHVDSFEFPDSSDQECHRCEKPIHVYRQVEVAYRTSKITTNPTP